MSKLLDLFDLVPGWVYAAVIAGLVLVGGGAIATQTVRLAGAQADNAKLVAAAEKDRADRLALVAAHNLKIGQMQAAHAKQQQEIISGYTDTVLRLQAERSLDRNRAQRVLDAAESNAARDREAARTDLAACQRVADRNEALYRMVAEGFDLVAEGRNLLGRATADIDALKGVIANDRALLGGSAP